MAAIERGELEVNDPRAAREAELAAQKAAKMRPKKAAGAAAGGASPGSAAAPVPPT